MVEQAIDDVWQVLLLVLVQHLLVLIQLLLLTLDLIPDLLMLVIQPVVQLLAKEQGIVVLHSLQITFHHLQLHPMTLVKIQDN
jgi:hypothetical protein